MTATQQASTKRQRQTLKLGSFDWRHKKALSAGKLLAIAMVGIGLKIIQNEMIQRGSATTWAINLTLGFLVVYLLGVASRRKAVDPKTDDLSVPLALYLTCFVVLLTAIPTS